MPRLIDADALIHELNNSHYPGAPYVDVGISIAIGKVCDAPTIEPDRQTGKWIDQKGGGCCCSECGRYALDEVNGNFIHVAAKSNYCPNCGAKMEEPEDIPMEYFESGGI